VKSFAQYFSVFRRAGWQFKIERPHSVRGLVEKTLSKGIEYLAHATSGGEDVREFAPSLPDIIQWARSFDVQQKPWLILGKGPSYQYLREINLNDFYTCSLNHVVREHVVDLAHIIDIDVVYDCAEAIEKNAKHLVLPFFPHINHSPTSKCVLDFVNEIPVLERLNNEGRLIWYNLSSSKRRIGSSPRIVAKFFSAEAALNILAECGAKTIRSLGVDGGSTYASHFEDLKAKTLLANTHKSFDGQFKEIAKTIRTKEIFYAPLHVEAPIRIFVGTDASQMLAAKVLEYSIKKHASMSVDVVPLCDVPVPLPKNPQNHPRTGFSFARFLIPSLCNYKGRAIYLDADMLVFSDISRLWEFPMSGADVICAEQPTAKGRIRQYSVMVMNCSNLRWDIQEIVNGFDDGKYNYSQLMYEFCIVPANKILPTLPYEWNSLEFYEQGKTCLIHYTDMPTQPWVSYKNAHRASWYHTLKEAIREGYIDREQLYAEIEGGHVLPGLPQHIGLPPHKEYGRLAKAFVPPYRRFAGS
jgi:hypothetical protein